MSDAPLINAPAGGDVEANESEADPAMGDVARDTEATRLADMSTDEQLDYFKSKARKAEDRLRGKSSNPNADVRTLRKERDQLKGDLDALRQTTMTEQERAVEAARSESRTIAMTEFGGKLVSAEFKVAASGRGLDVDALLEGVDRSKFLTDEGDPDTDAITAYVDRIAPSSAGEQVPAGFPPPPDLGQGNRQTVPLGSDPLLDLLKGSLGIK